MVGLGNQTVTAGQCHAGTGKGQRSAEALLADAEIQFALARLLQAGGQQQRRHQHGENRQVEQHGLPAGRKRRWNEQAQREHTADQHGQTGVEQGDIGKAQVEGGEQ